ncbi:MAG: putative toxin [Bacteroidota bacterium]
MKQFIKIIFFLLAIFYANISEAKVVTFYGIVSEVNITVNTVGIKINSTLCPVFKEHHITNPFASIKAKQRYATLSNGRFDEIHETVDSIQYYHALLNTKTKKILKLLPIETSDDYKVDPVVFALSVDPMSDKYPNISPYAYCAWNPVKLVDPDGKYSQIPPIFFATNPVLFSSNEIIEIGSRISTDEFIKTTPKTTNPKPINSQRLNIGRQVEAEQLERMGLNKNNESLKKIDPKTGKEGSTIPDGFKNGQTTEIKNLGEGLKQSFTKQLRLQEKISNDNGQNPILRINKEAGVTKPLENSSFEIQKYSIIPVRQDKTKVNINIKNE